MPRSTTVSADCIRTLSSPLLTLGRLLPKQWKIEATNSIHSKLCRTAPRYILKQMRSRRRPTFQSELIQRKKHVWRRPTPRRWRLRRRKWILLTSQEMEIAIPSHRKRGHYRENRSIYMGIPAWITYAIKSFFRPVASDTRFNNGRGQKYQREDRILCFYLKIGEYIYK